MVKRVGRTGKGLARITDDFKKVLSDALEVAVADIVQDLQQDIRDRQNRVPLRHQAGWCKVLHQGARRD